MNKWALISPPDSWTDLQQKVSTILDDCGYTAEVEKEIPLVRGKIVVDVYGKTAVNVPTIVLCECKHWNSRVSKAIVQQFKTTVAEGGAHHGFIISRKGFQSGAFAAIEKTNISLFCWEEFQDTFKTDWLKHWVDQIDRAGIELRTFIRRLGRWSKEKDATGSLIMSKWKEISQIRAAHEDWIFYAMRNNYTELNIREVSWAQALSTIEEGTMRDLPIHPKYLRDYFSAILNRCRDDIKAIESLFAGAIKCEPEKVLP